MDRALPDGDVQPREPRRSAVVTALGVTQIFAWGCSYYLPAVLAKPITAGTGWPLPWVVGGVSIGLFVSGLVSPLVGRTIQRCGGRAVLALSSILLARPRWDRSCSKPHHLSGGLDRDWTWYGCRTLRRGVRDARADLSRQRKKPNYDAYFVRWVFKHHLLAAQRFACFIGWVAVCVFHLCWSAACGEFADLLATLAAKY